MDELTRARAEIVSQAVRIQELETRERSLRRLASAALLALPDGSFDIIRERAASGEFDR